MASVFKIRFERRFLWTITFLIFMLVPIIVITFSESPSFPITSSPATISSMMEVASIASETTAASLRCIGCNAYRSNIRLLGQQLNRSGHQGGGINIIKQFFCIFLEFFQPGSLCSFRQARNSHPLIFLNDFR